jgi:hypothetical protein
MSEFAEPNLATRLSTADVALLLGENNTEARCITYLSITDSGMVPLNIITSKLAENEAFKYVPLTRFNVGGIIDATDNSLVVTTRDPHPDFGHSTIWVEKTPDTDLSQLANATAGLLLAYSLEHNRPIRSLLGEKRTTASGSNSIQNRLGVLAVAFDEEVVGRGFAPDDIAERNLADYGIPLLTTKRHIQNLVNAKIMSAINPRSTRLEFTIRPDGKETRLEVLELFKLIGSLATGSTEELKAALKRGRQIIDNPKWLPLLVKRSYASSGHTGKHSPHRSAATSR